VIYLFNLQEEDFARFAPHLINQESERLFYFMKNVEFHGNNKSQKTWDRAMFTTE